MIRRFFHFFPAIAALTIVLGGALLGSAIGWTRTIRWDWTDTVFAAAVANSAVGVAYSAGLIDLGPALAQLGFAA